MVSKPFNSISVASFDLTLEMPFTTTYSGMVFCDSSVPTESFSFLVCNTDGVITIKYSKAEFAKLSGKIKLNMEFCNSIVVNVDNSLTGLDVKTSYSNINLKPASDLSASYNISTSFGTLKNRTAIKFDGDDEDKNDRGPKFDHQYNGKSGNGGIPIKINTSFGNVILGEPGAGDMKDKDKSKSKTKTS